MVTGGCRKTKLDERESGSKDQDIRRQDHDWCELGLGNMMRQKTREKVRVCKVCSRRCSGSEPNTEKHEWITRSGRLEWRTTPTEQ